MKNTNRPSLFFNIEIFLLAANMRIAITSIPPIISMIAKTFNLSTAQMGALTTIPVLCFGFLSVLAGRIITKIGTGLSLQIALICLTTANILRVYTNSAMIVGTVLVGASIAVINVLMPTIIVEWHPESSTRLNGLYSAAMNLCSAIAGAIVVPIATQFGWEFMVQLLSVPAILAFIGWLFLPKNGKRKVPIRQSKDLKSVPKRKVWRRPEVWFLAIFMGCQSGVFYTVVAWLPNVLVSHGMTASTAGILFAVFQIAGVPFSYIVPRATSKASSMRMVMAGLCAGYLIGIGTLIINEAPFWILTIACIIAGITTSSIFTLVLSLITVISDSAQDAGMVGGFTQSVGYLIASAGPTIFGIVRSTSGSWPVTLAIILGVAVVAIVVGFGLIHHLSNKMMA